MKMISALCCLLFLALTINVIGGTAAMGEKVKFYQVTYQMDNVKGVLSINGFPVTELDGQPGSGSASLNPWLIGENELKAEVTKADPSQPAKFVFGLSEMVQGEMVDTTDQGSLFSVEIKDGDFDQAGKAVAARNFKSSFDFSRHLKPAGQPKAAEVLAYAKQVYALFVKKNADGILKEQSPKIDDYSQAFGGVPVKQETKNYLVTELFKAKLAKLNPAKLRAVATGPAGNIWHVFNGQDELIKAKTSDSSTLEMAIFIGLIDGKLKVVR